MMEKMILMSRNPWSCIPHKHCLSCTLDNSQVAVFLYSISVCMYSSENLTAELSLHLMFMLKSTARTIK